MDGERVSAVKGPDGKTNVANEKDCALPLAVRKAGNLPFEANSGVRGPSGAGKFLRAIGLGFGNHRTDALPLH